MTNEKNSVIMAPAILCRQLPLKKRKQNIDRGELYIGRVGDRIAAAMVLNQQYNPEYEDIVWTKFLDRSEFMVIHMLGVHSDFAGRVDFELLSWFCDC